jgi:integrase/recombinase XerD
LPQSVANLTPLQTICPVELLRLPMDLDGHSGTNRAIGNRPHIAAQNDVDALRAWLARFADTRTTFDSYRRASERLLLWATVELRKPLSSLTHEDMLVYQRFLSAPQPASRWVMATHRKLSRFDSAWRPFAGPLSPTSQRQSIVILNGLFSWLVNAGYLAGNPLSLSRQRNRKAQPRITRYLDHDLWNEVKVTIELMPKETEREREHYFRVRWLYSLFYIGGLRISEVVGNTMGDIFCRKDKDGEDRWWLDITGKGDKTRLVPATSELIVELARYRREVGLTPMPLPKETTPLLLPIGGKLRAMTRSALHQIVKTVFAMTANRIAAKGQEFSSRANLVRAASAHWMRHTGGTHMLDQGVSLLNVRDNFGHGSVATTNQYAHTEEDARHAEIERKHRIDWH